MSDEKQGDNTPIEPTTEPMIVQETAQPMQPATAPIFIQANEGGEGNTGPIQPETPPTSEQRGANPDNIETR